MKDIWLSKLKALIKNKSFVVVFSDLVFYTLLLLLPTQLAYHYFFNQSFVFGIRVDYLAATIYVTDVLVFLWVTISVFSNPRKIFNLTRKHKLYILAFVVFSVVNLLLSSFPLLSFIKWLKIYLFISFVATIVVNKRFSLQKVSRVLFVSSVFVSLIGIVQFIKGGSLNGLLYFLGERAFSTQTPGIALYNFFGREILRAYSTFSHPNSLAGYLGIVLILNFIKKEKRSLWMITGAIVILTALLLTFSYSSFIAIALVVVLSFVLKYKKVKAFIKPVIFGVLILTSILSVCSPKNIQLNTDQKISERLFLAKVSGQIISRNYLIGTGLNTFIPNITNNKEVDGFVWLLQPVHNIYLLTFSETGVVGVSLLLFLFYKGLKKSLVKNNVPIFLSIIFILTTGLFDHYWLTLQQNELLMLLIISYFI